MFFCCSCYPLVRLLVAFVRWILGCIETVLPIKKILADRGRSNQRRDIDRVFTRKPVCWKTRRHSIVSQFWGWRVVGALRNCGLRCEVTSLCNQCRSIVHNIASHFFALLFFCGVGRGQRYEINMQGFYTCSLVGVIVWSTQNDVLYSVMWEYTL